MITLEQKLAALPARERKAIQKRAAELIAEEMTMRELRKAHKRTQTQMAKALGVKQEQVSRIEKRTDMHISTLRRSIEALGGELTLVAKFPKGAPVEIMGLGDLHP
jgi:DNA-binding XRE family transcriptional regulator